MSEAEAPQIPDVDPAEFAKNVAQASDEDLAAGMSGEMRGVILDEIFKRMEEHFDAAKAAGADAVVQWKIGGRSDGGEDVYEITIKDGACKVSKEPTGEPRLTLAMGGVDFLKLVTNNASGPELFMAGKLKIEGDLIFATQVQSYFKIPTAAA
jgi:putative sterol carrier protein